MNDIAFPKPSMTAKDIFKDQIAATKNDEVTTFSLKAQMLDQGRTDTVLAATEDLSVRLKVYASGGENGLHAHVDRTMSLSFCKAAPSSSGRMRKKSTSAPTKAS